RIAPKTLAQKDYVDAIRSHTVTFAIGPAGTGKTYLAMALAVAALNERQVGRIILTRPAVEAGERLGFLPGDMLAKVDPYLRPLFDALYDILDPDRLAAYMERRTIEVAPLAFLRGRRRTAVVLGVDGAPGARAYPGGGRGELPAGLPRAPGDGVVCPQVVGTAWREPVVHALLHLLGYDDGPEMEAREGVYAGAPGAP